MDDPVGAYYEYDLGDIEARLQSVERAAKAFELYILNAADQPFHARKLALEALGLGN